MQHHARVFVANTLSTADLEDDLHSPGSDIVHISRDKLRIADVKEIKKYAYQRPAHRQYVDIVMFGEIYLPEAQNALLKLLEEPPNSTRFTLVVKDLQQILPTVRSRLSLCGSHSDRAENSESSSSTFLQHTPAERIKIIGDLAKDKDNKSMHTILQQCASVISTLSEPRTRQAAHNYHTLVTVMHYSQQNGSSLKMLLEYVALLLPVMKTK